MRIIRIMRGTPWKALLALSLLLTAAGGALLVWSIAKGVAWQGQITAALVVIFGALLARMNHRAYRHAAAPTPSTTLPIVGVGAFTLIWIAAMMRVI